ncbi:MAG: hypothetical protein DRP67_00925 [Candidatus Omnitrophota bacterium]|nr:MAG: hypothetical protein DRP67_00925 [Candidatus Omnitrophota bacterium]
MKKTQKIIVSVLFLIFLSLIGFYYYSIKKSKYKTVYYVYFLSSNQELKLIPVERTAKPFSDIEEKVKSSIKDLLNGPNQEEKEKNIITMIPEGVKLINCYIRNDTVFLDFSKDIEKGGGTEEMKARLAQIVFTATQFPEINKVRFMIEGKFIKYFGGEGLTDVEKPLERKDFIKVKRGE